jgi:hypothetical protein
MSNDPLNNENTDRDRTLKDDLGETIDKEQLSFNADANSYELDVKSDDPDYDHPDPYNTAPVVGDDFDSSYDEANPYAVDEYIPNESLETDVDQLGMHIDDGQILSDLDEEGYPKNDTPTDFPR